MKNFQRFAKPMLFCFAIILSLNASAQRMFVSVGFTHTNSEMSKKAVSLSSQTPSNSLYGSYFVNNDDPYTFRIFFKDSTKTFVNSFLYADSIKHSFYILAVDKSLPKTDPNREQRIYPEQTVSIIQFNDNGNLSGKPTDSCWLFKVIDGKINAYSLAPKVNGLKIEQLIAIQIGDGPIQKYTPGLVYPVIKDDNQALKEWNNLSFISAIKKYNKDNK